MSKRKSMSEYFKGLPTPDRITALRENAVEEYEKNVVRYYSEEELAEMKHQLSDEDLKIDDAEQEKKELTKEINDRIKKHKDMRSFLLRGIRNKYYENRETVYDLPNQEEGIMETYDGGGNLLATRRLTPAERQHRTIDINQKTA